MVMGLQTPDAAASAGHMGQDNPDDCPRPPSLQMPRLLPHQREAYLGPYLVHGHTRQQGHH